MNKNTTINNHNLQLTNEEYDVYTYLNEFYPDLIDHFKQYILIGRDFNVLLHLYIVKTTR